MPFDYTGIQSLHNVILGCKDKSMLKEPWNSHIGHIAVNASKAYVTSLNMGQRLQEFWKV
jgi:hypothetical protein